jgi:hypothetical protein
MISRRAVAGLLLAFISLAFVPGTGDMSGRRTSVEMYEVAIDREWQ